MSSNNTFAVLSESGANGVPCTLARNKTWADETQEEVDRAAAAKATAETEALVFVEEKVIGKDATTVAAAPAPLAAETPCAVFPESKCDDSKSSAFPDSWDEYMDSMPIVFTSHLQLAHDWELTAESEARDWFGAGMSHEDNDAITAEDLQRLHEEAGKVKQSEVAPSSPVGGSTTSNTETSEDPQKSEFEFDELEESTDATDEDGIYANDIGDLLDYLSDIDADVPDGCVDANDLLTAIEGVTAKSVTDRLSPEVLDEDVSHSDTDALEDTTGASNADKHVTHAPDDDKSTSSDNQFISRKPVVTRKKNYRTKAERARAKKRTAAAAAAIEIDQDRDEKVGSGLSEQEILEGYTASQNQKHVAESKPSSSRKAWKPADPVSTAASAKVPAACPLKDRIVAAVAGWYQSATFGLLFLVVLGFVLTLMITIDAVLAQFEKIK